MENLETFRSLGWLLEIDNLHARCAAILADPKDCGVAVRKLATHGLTEVQLRRVASLIEELQRVGHDLAPLRPYRLGVLGFANLGLLEPLLIATAARHGLLLETHIGEYGQAAQDILSPDSRFNAIRHDAVLLALDHRAFPTTTPFGDAEIAGASIESVTSLIERMCDAIIARGAIAIVQTIPPPPIALFGSLDRILPGTRRAFVEGLNAKLIERLAGKVHFLDIAALAETVGLANWHAPTHWNIAKLAFSAEYVPLYADHVCRLIAAMLGESRKALILDLDNTLWGGEVGDVGMENILIGEGNATGEAFLAVQRFALDLRNRGIVLAVVSKNEDHIARQVFKEHPDMLLREEHIDVFQANWSDKATNIKAIAKVLNLSTAAMVFLDDNPAERDLVRKYLPEVAVPELPEDPAYFPRVLAAAGYFETVHFSHEDAARADYYRGNARRTDLVGRFTDIDEYLVALDMRAHFAPFNSLSRPRVLQLINKSNQFNVTARRCNEAELVAAEQDEDGLTLQLRLSDIFGDNGMISAVICKLRDGDAWFIDTWTMSCRVLGRKVEQVIIAEIVRNARQQGVRRLIGSYRPTERNMLVSDLFPRLGFGPSAFSHDDLACWELPVAGTLPEVLMAVERSGFADNRV